MILFVILGQGFCFGKVRSDERDGKNQKTFGLGLALGTGYGFGLVGYYNLNEKWQIRPGMGASADFGKNPLKKYSYQTPDTVIALGADYVFTVNGRYYFRSEFFVASGFSYVRRFLAAEAYDSWKSPTIGRKTVHVIFLPLKLGAELGKNSRFGSSLELGYNLNVNHFNDIIRYKFQARTGEVVGEYYFTGGDFLWGFTFTFNF